MAQRADQAEEAMACDDADFKTEGHPFIGSKGRRFFKIEGEKVISNGWITGWLPQA